MRIYAVAMALLLFALPVFAADIDGKWSGTASTPNGQFPQSFVFKTDGDKLTGTLTVMGMDVPINDGKIDGNNVSFSVTLNFGQQFIIAYKGVVSGDEIKFSADAGGIQFDLVAKRDK